MLQGRLNSSPVYSLNGLGASRKIFCIKPLLLLPPCGEIWQKAPLAATKFICSLWFVSHQLYLERFRDQSIFNNDRNYNLILLCQRKPCIGCSKLFYVSSHSICYKVPQKEQAFSAAPELWGRGTLQLFRNIPSLFLSVSGCRKSPSNQQCHGYCNKKMCFHLGELS